MRSEHISGLNQIYMRVQSWWFRNKIRRRVVVMTWLRCCRIWGIFSSRLNSTRIWRNSQWWRKMNFSSLLLRLIIKSTSLMKSCRRWNRRVLAIDLVFIVSRMDRLFNDCSRKWWAWRKAERREEWGRLPFQGGMSPNKGCPRMNLPAMS